MNLPTEKDIRRDSYWFGDLYGMKVQQLAQQLAAEEEARKRQQEEDAIMADLIARQMGLPPRSQQPYATPEAQMPPPPVEGAPQRSFKETALEQGVYGTQDPRNQARIKAMEELEKEKSQKERRTTASAQMLELADVMERESAGAEDPKASQGYRLVSQILKTIALSPDEEIEKYGVILKEVGQAAGAGIETGMQPPKKTLAEEVAEIMAGTQARLQIQEPYKIGAEERAEQRKITAEERKAATKTKQEETKRANQLGLLMALGEKVPASGRALGLWQKGTAAAGFNPNVKAYEDVLSSFLGNIAKEYGGESGRLTDQDIARAKRMAFSVFDTEREREIKKSVWNVLKRPGLTDIDIQKALVAGESGLTSEGAQGANTTEKSDNMSEEDWARLQELRRKKAEGTLR